MAHLSLEEAYPSLSFRPKSRNWWARLARVPAECVHLETNPYWAATYIPDTLFLRGKARVVKERARPEVSLCRECLLTIFEEDLALYPGRVVAFEPDCTQFTQFFFVAEPDFDAAGLKPEVSAAISRRLTESSVVCETCSNPAAWLWFSREDVPSLDDTDRIAMASGRVFCALHGSRTLCRSLGACEDVNLFYVNAPYSGSGAYVWI
jgi:hypothetical protein